MRLAVAGTPEVALPTLNYLVEHGYDLKLVISQPDAPTGRGRALTPSPVSQWAIAHNVELVRPARPQELGTYLQDIDCVITIAYGVLLPESILTIPQHGFINLHFSILPAYRGAAPVQRAILDGVKETGVTVFALDQGMDTGPVYQVRKLKLEDSSNTSTVLERLSVLGIEAIAETLKDIELGKKPQPQIPDGASIAPKVTKDELRIDWNQKANAIVNRIRAFSLEPGAWTLRKGERLKIVAARATDIPSLSPGALRVDSGLFVGCADFDIEILEVVPAGKRLMQASEWIRGAHIDLGEVLE